MNMLPNIDLIRVSATAYNAVKREAKLLSDIARKENVTMRVATHYAKDTPPILTVSAKPINDTRSFFKRLFYPKARITVFEDHYVGTMEHNEGRNILSELISRRINKILK